ncbi:MAG: hypothetical protein M1524_01310 [Patescibacteria group bacterium]|nr:hypothetical protein [Patescibacteria group bacterium]
MAGTFKERPLGQAGKERIGNFYLALLLNGFENQQRTEMPFDEVQEGLYRRINSQLPDALVKMLNLDNMSWQMFGSAGLPRLMLGFYGKRPKMPIRSADATIEMANRVVLNGSSDTTFHPKPVLVRIAGYSLSLNRVVAATYETSNHKELIRANVSLAQKEASLFEDERSFPGCLRGCFLAGIPTNRSFPYSTAGLVTDQMVYSTLISSDPKHTVALSVANDTRGVYFGRPDKKDLGANTILGKEVDFCAERTPASVIVSLDSKQNGLDIQFPRRLQGA